MIRIGVIGSGSGTNFASIAESIANGTVTGVEPALVISDNENAKILERARSYAIPAVYLAADDFKTKLDGQQEQAYIKALRDARVDYVVLAGFMRMVKPGLLEAYKGYILNIHPSLLPAFGGKGMYGHHVHAASIERGVTVSGCTVHLVDNHYDNGPIILQRACKVLPDDTPDTLAARVFEKECEALPAALQKLQR